MTDTIKQKALALLNEARAKLGFPPFDRCDRSFYAVEALCRAIEQHEAFRQEVSDAVEADINKQIQYGVEPKFRTNSARFILPKPDPLVEALDSLGLEKADEWAPDIRKALAARGGRIVWEGE